MTAVLTAGMVALLTSAVLTPVARRLAIARGYLDVPNERSSHERPTPKTGGYAIIAGLVTAVGVTGAWREGAVAVIVAGALALATLAVIDDHRPLPRMLRFAFQIAIALLVVAGLAQMHASIPREPSLAVWLAGGVALVWLVGVINTYNFMDGLNGISSLAAIVTGVTLAILALRRGDVPMAALSAAIAAAAAGFVPFNLRGSIFMGDTGSTTLGFVLGGSVLAAMRPGAWPIAAALPLLPFVLDAGVTIARRALRGERFFATPHRSHYYQRLQQQGWSHGAVSAIYAALTASCAAVALVFDRLSTKQSVAIVAALLLGHACMFAAVQTGWSRHVGREDAHRVATSPRAKL